MPHKKRHFISFKACLRNKDLNNCKAIFFFTSTPFYEEIFETSCASTSLDF